MRIRAIAASAALVGGVLFAGTGTASAATTITVHPGQSIQAAVSAAQPGDTIIVQKGVYHESVVVLTSGIALVGQGAVLEPPADPTAGCFDPSSGQSGICLFGMQSPSGAITRIANVRVSGFTVQHFTGVGILMIGGQNVEVSWNTAAANDEYGIARFESMGGSVQHNDVSGADEAGIYWGDSQHSNALIAWNTAHQNGNFGIFVRDSSNGEVRNNTAWGNCVGLMFLRTREVPVQGWNVHDNVSKANNNACPPSEEGPPLSGLGIVLAGASHNRFWNNVVERNVGGGPSLASGGIVVISTTPFGGGDPVGNTVTGNRLRNNNPDLLYDGSGSGNNLTGNSCSTSVPAGLC
jgi:parallel beta-helix repeat protein